LLPGTHVQMARKHGGPDIAAVLAELSH
jgi:hypothetical protein